MRIFIAGATGRVAEELIANLRALGHSIVAGARHPERVRQEPLVEPVALDLHADVEALAQAIKGSDAVYFVAGSRGQDLLQTDAFGAVKLMQASEKVGIKRFIMLSSIFATNPEKWQGAYFKQLEDYNIAKFFADKWLMQNTSLDYTILQPGRLLETQGTGHIATMVSEPGENAISDVATVLAEFLDKPNTYHKVITMSAGQVPIKDAIATL